MVNDSEGNPVQMKIVESSDSGLPSLSRAALKRKEKKLADERNKNEIYQEAVREAAAYLDKRVLDQLESTQKELQATRQSQQELIEALATQTKNNHEQSHRYQNSTERLIATIQDSIVNNQDPHIAYSDCDWGKPDVIVTNGNVPSEIVYKYTSGILGQFVGISPGRMGTILRRFEIYDDPRFHCAFSVGKSSHCHKYKISSLKEIFFRKGEPKYKSILKPNEITQIHTYLKMRAEEHGL